MSEGLSVILFSIYYWKSLLRVLAMSSVDCFRNQLILTVSWCLSLEFLLGY